MKREQILIGISIIFLSISAYIVYSSFFGSAGPITLQLPTTNTDNSTLVNVKALNKQIEGSLKNLGPDGSLSQLESSAQYQSLTGEANIGVQIGIYGQRTNPFLPLVYSTSTDVKQ